MIGRARAYLTAHYTPIADLAAFERRTDPDSLLPLDQPLRDVISLCAQNPDWSNKLALLEFVYKIDDTPLP